MNFLGEDIGNDVRNEYNSSDFDMEKESIICIDVQNGRLGASILCCSSNNLKRLDKDYCLNLAYDSHAKLDGIPRGKYADEVFMIAESLILESSSTLCLLAAKLEEVYFKNIEIICKNVNCRVELRPNQDFKNIETIGQLQMLDHDGITLLNDLVLNSSLAASTTAGTVSCVLSFLDSFLYEGLNSTSSSLSIVASTSQYSMIHRMETMQLKDRLFLDEESLRALHIFPPTRMTGQDVLVKNGFLSIFELLNNISSNVGQKLLKSWLICPLSNKQQIEERYKILRILLESCNAGAFENLRETSKHLPDVFSVFNKFQNGQVKLSSWCSLRAFLRKGVDFYHFIALLQFDRESRNLFVEIQDSLDVSILVDLQKYLETIINFEESKETKTVVINHRVNETLDSYKNIYNNLERILGDVARRTEALFRQTVEKNGLDLNLPNCDLINAVYIPQLCYMITIDISLEPTIRMIDNIEWDEIFRTSTNIYYKNAAILELDKRFGDIYGLISDLEIEVLQPLQNMMIENRSILCSYRNNLAKLEVLMSFAIVALERNYIEPELSETECILEIKEGRHPLHESFADRYIPNDIGLNGGHYSNDEGIDERPSWAISGKARIAIVTGANQSGKSVFLAQNGLIVFLAHIGCYVPAKMAKIGIVDKLLTRVRTNESISRAQSSFAQDAQQMAKCLSLATQRSLVLIDEFGKGTDVVDGPAIFGAIVSVLAHTEACPRVISCTHFHELFKPEILTTRIPGVIHYATEILLDRGGSRSEIVVKENTGITFLYSIKEGISKQSFGIYCASICGIAPSIVKRAEQLSKWIDEGYNIVEHCGKLSERELAQFQINQERVKAFITWDLDLESKTNSRDLKELTRKLLER